MTAPAAPRLTQAQRNVLGKLLDGAHVHAATGNVLSGGGVQSALNALQRKGLVDVNGQPTPAGRAVFAPRQVAGRVTQRAVNVLAAVALGLLLGTAHLLDGPSEPEAAQINADALAEAIAQARAEARIAAHAPR